MNGYSNTGFTQTLNGIYSITDGMGSVIEGGEITTVDMMTDNVVSGRIGCGALNSSTFITCAKVICEKISCNTITANDVYYKNKICGYINIGISPFLKIPLTTSLLDTTTSITNFDLSTYLINANNNSIFLLPYYNVIFYNNNDILQIC